MLNELLQEKHQIEAEMQSNAQDSTTRARYFDVLNRIARSHFGAFYACFPEIMTPLLFRGGSSDVWNLQQVFFDRQYAVEVFEPQRILDLGAYVGYTAVFFANRFPNAQIVSVEPPGSNFDTLAANTVAYPNIRCLPAGVWHERTEIVIGEYTYGDWGTGFTPKPAAGSENTVPAYTITDILETYGWDGIDLLKCSSHAGRIDVLLKPRPAWLDKTLTVITRPGSAGWHPRDLQEVNATLPEAEFERRNHGPLIVFSRRGLKQTPTSEPSPKVLHLVPTIPQRRQFTISNVAEKLNFYRFGYAGIQLTPNPPTSSIATFTTQVTLAGHSRFRVRLRTGDAPAGRIKFTVQVRGCETGATAVNADQAIPMNSVFDWDLAFAPAWGLHSVILSTETTEGGGEHRRPSHLIDPSFL
jgi:FkbM family methyltransferase